MSPIIFRFMLICGCLCLVCAAGYWISNRGMRKTTRSRLIYSSSRALNLELFSLEGMETLTLWAGGHAEVRRSFCDSVLTRKTEGVWEFDEHFGRCRINVDKHVTEYLLVT